MVMGEAGYDKAWLGGGLEWAVGSSLLFSSPAEAAWGAMLLSFQRKTATSTRDRP